MQADPNRPGTPAGADAAPADAASGAHGSSERRSHGAGSRPDIDAAPLDQLIAIRHEQARLDQFRERAETLQAQVDEPVFRRVVDDYTRRHRALEQRAEPLKAQARGEFRTLQRWRADVERTHEDARLVRQELQFRHAVGELDEAALEAQVRDPEETLARCREELSAIDALHARFAEAFGSAEALDADMQAAAALPADAPPQAGDAAGAAADAEAGSTGNPALAAVGHRDATSEGAASGDAASADAVASADPASASGRATAEASESALEAASTAGDVDGVDAVGSASMGSSSITRTIGDAQDSAHAVTELPAAPGASAGTSVGARAQASASASPERRDGHDGLETIAGWSGDAGTLSDRERRSEAETLVDVDAAASADADAGAGAGVGAGAGAGAGSGAGAGDSHVGRASAGVAAGAAAAAAVATDRAARGDAPAHARHDDASGTGGGDASHAFAGVQQAAGGEPVLSSDQTNIFMMPDDGLAQADGDADDAGGGAAQSSHTAIMSVGVLLELFVPEEARESPDAAFAARVLARHPLGMSTTVGRSDESQLRVVNPSVSRQHAVITAAADGYVIHDLHSQNGTFVNGERVETCALRDGDEIVFGDASFLFRAFAPGAAPPDGDAEAGAGFGAATGNPASGGGARTNV